MKIKTIHLKIALIPIFIFILFFIYILTLGLLSSYLDHDIYLIKVLFYLSLYITSGFAIVITALIFKILTLIDKERAFTSQALKLISKIKNLFVAMTVVLSVSLPMLFYIVEVVKIPLLLIIGLAIVVSPIIIALFVATIEKLLYSIIQIKIENDLTV